jgi:hypothetical protein
MSKTKKCPYCNYEVPFRRGSSLKRHVKRMHNENYNDFLIEYDKKYTIKRKSKISKKIQRISKYLINLVDVYDVSFVCLRKRITGYYIEHDKQFVIDLEYFSHDLGENLQETKKYEKKYFVENIIEISTDIYNIIRSYDNKLKNKKREDYKKAKEIINKYQITHIPNKDKFYDIGFHYIDELDWFMNKYIRNHENILKELVDQDKKNKQDNYHLEIKKVKEDQILLERYGTTDIEYILKHFPFQPIQHERIARDNFDLSLFPLLEEKGYEVKVEYRINPNTNHRIDYLILGEDFSFGIEYKASNVYWSSNHLENQSQFYEEELKKKYPNIKVLIVSDNGKYGISDTECLDYIKNS